MPIHHPQFTLPNHMDNADLRSTLASDTASGIRLQHNGQGHDSANSVRRVLGPLAARHGASSICSEMTNDHDTTTKGSGIMRKSLIDTPLGSLLEGLFAIGASRGARFIQARSPDSEKRP